MTATALTTRYLSCASPYVCCLQVLPLRASIAHHDAHHKYSNHHLNAKNYSETFWVWDALFKTLSSLSGHASARQPVKSQ